jgi:hypothetical protein
MIVQEYCSSVRVFRLLGDYSGGCGAGMDGLFVAYMTMSARVTDGFAFDRVGARLSTLGLTFPLNGTVARPFRPPYADTGDYLEADYFFLK